MRKQIVIALDRVRLRAPSIAAFGSPSGRPPRHPVGTVTIVTRRLAGASCIQSHQFHTCPQLSHSSSFIQTDYLKILSSDI